MVLWGQSAGANAVTTYSYANPDDPIVTGIIADSGAPASGPGANSTSFSMMAASLGCGNLTAANELSCMQKIDALVVQHYVEVTAKGEFGGVGGQVADNVTAFYNPMQRLSEGRIAKVVSRVEIFRVPCN
jgi:carboxylesterase type B